jgi:hypothetical protein
MAQDAEGKNDGLNKSRIEESLKSGERVSGGDPVDLLGSYQDETKPLLYRQFKGDEKILEDTVRLPVIETSHPKGVIVEKKEFLRRFVQIEKAEVNKNSRGVARAIEAELLNLQPTGLSNKGLPETLEELGDMANSAEGKIDDVLEDDYVKINKSELALLTLMSTIAENIRRLESIYAQNSEFDRDSKLKSIVFQQEVFKTIFQFYDTEKAFGQFNGLVATIMQVSEIYLNGKIKGHNNRSLVDHPGYMDGIRGMLTTAILLEKNGLPVYLPDPKDDLTEGCDLITIIDGHNVAVSIKAKLGQLDAAENITKIDPLSATMSFVTHSPFLNAKYIFLEIPNIHNSTSIRSDEFYETQKRVLPIEAARLMGLPSELAEEWMRREIELVEKQLKQTSQG